jgi:hypothetical protein
MKKVIFLFASAIALISCEKNVEFNNPAFQAQINGSLWKSSTMSATKSATGQVVLKGVSATGNLQINLNSSALGARTLGTINTSNFISYSFANDTANFDYTTGITFAPVNNISLFSGGTGYTTSSLVATTGGSGLGLKVDIVANASGVITSVLVNSPGTNYRAGDLVNIVGLNSNASIIVQNVTKSNGEVTITEYDGATISGNFKFTAFDAGNNQTAACRDGVFYKVPVN